MEVSARSRTIAGAGRADEGRPLAGNPGKYMDSMKDQVACVFAPVWLILPLGVAVATAVRRLTLR
jgi:hypothetical protein